MSKKQPASSSHLHQVVEQDEYVDVAIVGGGVAGVYSAWRLATCGLQVNKELLDLAKNEHGKSSKHKGKLKIRLYESDDRIGGRLYSVTPPEMPHLKAEVGGMRYLTTHLLLVNLIEQLHLPSKPFPMGDKKHTLFYLRRQHLRLKDFADPKKVPYNLAWNEQGKSPEELMLYAINTVIRNAEHKTQDEWKQIQRDKEIFGTHLYDLGFWNLLYQILSSEAYNLVQDAGGYSSILSNWNAGEAIPWFLADFPKEVTYRTLTFGYDQLPITLGQRFEDEAGADTKIHTGHRLTSFELPDKHDKWITLNFNKRKHVKAKRLILAMPRRSLELVLGKDLLEDEALRRDIEAVRPQPAAKLFLGYREPWWQVLNLTSGRSSTDLPIRQTYYFGTECNEMGADPNNSCSLLMASYNDGPSVGFWKGLLDKKPGTNEIGINIPFKGDMEDSDELNYLKAQNLIPSRGMVREAHYELKQLHGIDLYIPKPYMAIYKDWGDDPFGGGWHFWKMNQKPWEVMKRMRAPKLRGRKQPHVYICGEAYSCNQGWVEGALKSAELMLQKYFGLKTPSWLPKDYDLGP